MPKRRSLPVRWGGRFLDWLGDVGPDLLNLIIDVILGWFT